MNRPTFQLVGRAVGVFGLAIAFASRPATAQSQPEYEQPPIRYSETAASNRVTALQARLDRGEVNLRGVGDRETLQRSLAAVGIAAESQVLVFSKTSLQRQRISPQTPRAIYFSDDAYFGWVPGGLFEVTVTDPQLGLAFYAVDPRESGRITFQRDNDCLSCHAGPLTRQWPAVMIRSIYPDATGEPISRAGSFLTTHESPLAERWGGWYVTGRHAGPPHLGNAIARESGNHVELDRRADGTIESLAKAFPADRYLSGESDIVALMVLEHQVGMHNRLVEGALRVRKWMHYQQALQKELGQAVLTEPTGTALRVVQSEAQRIVEHLLFVGEVPLPEGGVQGSGRFETAFRQNRRPDPSGRSLKDFDLRTRLFTHRCSYLIYSESFDSLPSVLKGEVYRRLDAVLTADQVPKPFAHLTAEERRTVREILVATEPEFVAATSAGAAK